MQEIDTGRVSSKVQKLSRTPRSEKSKTIDVNAVADFDNDSNRKSVSPRSP